MAEADQTLQSLKEALQRLLVMVSPLPRETLQLYLATSDEVILSVLTVERNKKRLLIHFVSRALQSPEVNYPIGPHVDLYSQTSQTLL